MLSLSTSHLGLIEGGPLAKQIYGHFDVASETLRSLFLAVRALTDRGADGRLDRFVKCAKTEGAAPSEMDSLIIAARVAMGALQVVYNDMPFQWTLDMGHPAADKPKVDHLWPFGQAIEENRRLRINVIDRLDLVQYAGWIGREGTLQAVVQRLFGMSSRQAGDVWNFQLVGERLRTYGYDRYLKRVGEVIASAVSMVDNVLSEASAGTRTCPPGVAPAVPAPIEFVPEAIAAPMPFVTAAAPVATVSTGPPVAAVVPAPSELAWTQPIRIGRVAATGTTPYSFAVTEPLRQAVYAQPYAAPAPTYYYAPAERATAFY